MHAGKAMPCICLLMMNRFKNELYYYHFFAIVVVKLKVSCCLKYSSL